MSPPKSIVEVDIFRDFISKFVDHLRSEMNHLSFLRSQPRERKERCTLIISRYENLFFFMEKEVAKFDDVIESYYGGCGDYELDRPLFMIQKDVNLIYSSAERDDVPNFLSKFSVYK